MMNHQSFKQVAVAFLVPVTLCVGACESGKLHKAMDSGTGNHSSAEGDATGATDTDADADSDGDADADTGADAGADTGTDTDGDADGDAGNDAGCEYMDLEVFLVQCSAGWTTIHHFQRMAGDPALCPDYYEVQGVHYSDLASAIDALGCDADCLYRPFESVMFLHCGHRMEYTAYGAEDPSCPGVLGFPDGIYDSFEEWEAANPCP